MISIHVLCNGARISLTIGFVAAFINLVIGVAYGGIAGYIGGKVDRIMMGIVDVLYGIPLLLYVILLMVVLGPGLIFYFRSVGDCVLLIWPVSYAAKF